MMTNGSLKSQLASLRPNLLRLTFELIVVFAGVFGALWVDSRKEDRERKDRALRIADAISAEITSLNTWYRPWRDTIKVHYEGWKTRFEHGDRPAPYFFRVPGSEHLPTVGWQAAVSSGVLEVLSPSLVFDIGNAYHEWNDIGDRVARYHASTEAIVFPLVGGQLRGSFDEDPDGWQLHPHRAWSDHFLDYSTPSAYDAKGDLRPEFAANLALMEETLAQLDSRFRMAVNVKTRLDSAVAALRK
jgi:hypothetical protein